MVKKVLIILPHFTLGGAETQAFNLANALNQLPEYKVEVMAFAKKEKLIDQLDENSIVWDFYPLPFSIYTTRWKKYTALLKLAKHLRKKKIDIAIPYTFYPNIFINSIKRLARIKKVFWNQRGKDVVGVSLIEKLLPKKRINYIANANVCKDFIAERHQIHPDKVTVINNGIDCEQAKKNRSEWRKELGIDEETIVLTMVANYYPEKDHITVLKAFKQLIENHKGVSLKLLFVGYTSGLSLLHKVKALAYDLELYNNLLFLDSTNDISGLLQATDIGVLSSYSEGCPNSILEYMYFGLPVVASDIPAIREVFSKDYQYLFKLEDEQDLLNHLATLVNSVDLRKRVGLDNKSHVIKAYELQKMIDNYIQLIN